MPEPVIRCLSEGSRRGQADKGTSKQYFSDAIEAHESLPQLCDGSAYLKEMCPKFAAPQQR
jgi:hypothetical protein